jgi:3'-phosphoadenosine 5'-phosphosulfate sulfotransferase (PAPS reductase)/FAD synthetase
MKKTNLENRGNTEKVQRLAYNAQWEAAVTTLIKKNIKSLEVICPNCKQKGLLFSKWIKGPQKKPLFVCHPNGGRQLNLCPINNESSPTLRATAKLSRSDILKLIRMGRPIVLFSGGQDSLCLLHYINSLAKSIHKQITAMHADTTAGFPEVEAYVQEVCDRFVIPLEIVHPKNDYFDLAKRWGIPGAKSRWCCETLKIAPLRRYLSQIKEEIVIFDGIRAAESHIRAKYLPVWYHPSFRCISVSPIFHWSDVKIQDYIEKQSLPVSPAAKLNTSAECWCGAYKSRKDFEALLSIHPEIFDKLVEVEAAQNGKFTFIYEGNERIPLCSLKSKRHLINKIHDKQDRGEC